MNRPSGTALVTGAAVRVGRAIALDLAKNGWAVAVHYSGSAAAAEATAAEIIAAGGQAATIQCDLSQEAEVATLVARAATALGPLTLLVNNASRFEADTIRDATGAGWDAHLDINLKAPFFLCQAFASQLPPGAEGNIVNIIDMRVWRLTPFFASYTVSKAGLWTLTQTLAMALAPRIRVNGIGPGPTLANVRQTAEQFAKQAASTPLGRGGGPEEIAAAVRFLISARSMTGQMLALDGGQHLPWPPPAEE